MRKKLPVVVFIISLVIISCSRDMTDPPDNSCGSDVDYVGTSKAIIDAACAYSGCHDGQSSGVPFNFTTFQGLQTVLDNGSFSNRVFDLKDNPETGMPPDRAVDLGGKTDLDAEELEMLMMWADAGFPEFSQKLTASYDETIKEIIDTNCAYGVCHNGSPGVPGDYSSFDGLGLDIESGSFFQRVVVIRDDPVQGMPPDRAEGPGDLTEEEFQLILCWVENGYPES